MPITDLSMSKNCLFLRLGGKMKRIFCNLQSITKTFFSITGSVFGLIAIVTAFISWDDMQIDVKQRLVIFVIAIIFSLVSAMMYILFFRRKNCIWSNGTGSVNVVYGDIIKIAFKDKEARNKVIVIPVNTSFDIIVDSNITSVNKPLVSPQSIHGQWIKALISEGLTESEIHKMVQDAIQKRDLRIQRKCSVEEKERGNLNCYDRGSLVFVSHRSKTTFMLVALADFDDCNKGQCTEEEFIKVIMNIIDAYNDCAQGYDIYIPLMGTGFSRVSLSNKESLQKIKACIEICKRKIHGTVNIVIFKNDMDKVTIFD